MDGGFGDDVRVQPVAEVNGIDVIAKINVSFSSRLCSDSPNEVFDLGAGHEGKAEGEKKGTLVVGEAAPFEIRVHDREEDLEEEVDGVDQDGEEVQPCFAGHLCYE